MKYQIIKDSWYPKKCKIFYGNKKAISPVVGTALLLIVTVVSILSYQNWFTTYSSSIHNEVEIKNNNNLNIETISGDLLYIKNDKNNNLSIKEIQVNGETCLTNVNISPGVKGIDIKLLLLLISTSLCIELEYVVNQF